MALPMTDPTHTHRGTTSSQAAAASRESSHRGRLPPGPRHPAREAPARRPRRRRKTTTSTGLPAKGPLSCSGEQAERPAWIPDDLLAEHGCFWTGRYGGPVSEKEAVEIIMNLKRLAEAIAGSLLEGREL